jgi:hypothetical protein
MQELYTAMSKAFPEIEGALKDSNNPHFKSKYADLTSVVMAIKPALANHGLWFRQVNHMMDGGVCVETIICHASGQEVTCGQLYVPASKQDAQGYGSALTYARRYSLSAAFGVCPEDDDGNAATAAPKAPPAPSVQPINQQQFLELQALIESTGTDIAGMCRFYKIAALNALPSDKFDHAKAALAKKVIDNA